MQINITDEFVSICEEILRSNKTNEEWAEIESDDMFQTDSFCGGYDSDEKAFCFSYYTENDDEYWFQLTLHEVNKVVDGKLKVLVGRPSE